jgi:hypothetical protein
MTETEINEIKEELQTLRLLYKKIAEQHIQTKTPTPEDIVALETSEETIDLDLILARRGEKGPQYQKHV